MGLMVDVFISYSRANKDKVSRLARAIEQAGYDVWWDAELPPHMSYGDVITAKIQSAKAAVVVWSEDAAASEWVRAEADVARNRKKLVQTALGDISPPLPFNQIQYANLGDWNGEDDHPEWRKVKGSLEALCGPRAPKDRVPAYAFPAGTPPGVATAKPAAAGPPPPPVAATPPAPPRPAPAAAPMAAMAAAPAGDAPPAAPGTSKKPLLIGAGVLLLGLSAAGYMMSGGDSGKDRPADDPTAAASGGAQPQALASSGPLAAPPAAPAKPADAPAAPPVAANPPANPPAGQQQQFNRNVTLVNQSGDTIMYLYWSNTSQSEWGSDQLGSDVLPDGQSIAANVDDGSNACEFDMMAVTSSGRQITHQAVNVCSVSEVYFQ
jgi:hypothetical protein